MEPQLLLLSARSPAALDVATSNLATTDPFDATVSGEQRSRGFEFETAAELLPGLQLIAAYTYLDAEVTEDNDIPVGTPLLGVPDHTVSAWLKYTVQDGPLKGFGVKRVSVEKAHGLALGRAFFAQSDAAVTDGLESVGDDRAVPGVVEPAVGEPVVVPRVVHGAVDGDVDELLGYLADIAPREHVYFVHSYAAPLSELTLACTSYGEAFSAIVRRGNVYGAQFHPERSARAGAVLLRNFLRLH